MHLADAFIQNDLQCILAVHLYCQYVCSLGIEPTAFALLMQCSNVVIPRVIPQVIKLSHLIAQSHMTFLMHMEEFIR